MSDKQALELTLTLDREPLPTSTKTTAYLVSEVTALGWGVEHVRPALSVVFVLDVSGSMSGPPLEQVIHSMDQLVGLLDPSDRIGIVVFSDNASELIPLQSASAEAVQTARSRVRRLTAGGNTNLEEGLHRSFGLLPARAEHERQVMLLLSDGAPNVGKSSREELAGLVQSFRPGVSVSCLGFGPHHQEDLLTAIRDAGGGRYHFIQDPAVCSFEFAQAIGTQGDIVAENVTLTLKPEEGVEVTRLLGGLRTHVGPSGMIVPVPDLLEGTHHLVVAELELQPGREPGPWEPLRVSISYNRVGRKEGLSLERSLQVKVAAQASALIPAVHAKVLLVRCGESRAEARAMADRKQYAGAAAILRAMIASIQSSPGFRQGDGSPLAEACEQLVDEATFLERKPQAEQYAAHRRTSATVDFTESTSYVAASRPFCSARSQGLFEEITGGLPQAQLVIVTGPGAGQRFPLKAVQVIGRTSSADVQIACPEVSRRHAQIVAQGGCFLVLDLGSTQGTRVNGHRLVGESRRLREGDILDLGGVELRYEEE